MPIGATIHGIYNPTHGPNAKLFQTCDSGEAIKVRNALWASPKAIRNRIIVLAIAPGKIVPGKLCFQSFNYASKNDWIYRFDYYVVARLQRYADELIFLDPHPDAPDFDHSFSSPTYTRVIRKHTEDYILNYVNYR